MQGRRAVAVASLVLGCFLCVAANPPKPPAPGIRSPKTGANQGKGAKAHLNVKHIDFLLEADDDTKVRLLELPKQVDDKGKAKKYTKEELKEKKGPDPKQPGYQADYIDLSAGEMVKVTFVKPKKEAKPDDKKKPDEDVKEDDKKKPDKPVDPGFEELTGHIVRMEGSTKKFVLRVDYASLGQNRNANQNNAGNNGKAKEVPIERHVALILIETTDVPSPKGQKK